MNNQVELTPLSAKSYHGNMTDSNTAEKLQGQVSAKAAETKPETPVVDKTAKDSPIFRVVTDKTEVEEDKKRFEQRKSNTVEKKEKRKRGIGSKSNSTDGAERDYCGAKKS